MELYTKLGMSILLLSVIYDFHTNVELSRDSLTCNCYVELEVTKAGMFLALKFEQDFSYRVIARQSEWETHPRASRNNYLSPLV